MRLPYTKVYRAFPELDRFPDSECERFVKQARAQVKRGKDLVPIGVAISAAAVWVEAVRLFPRMGNALGSPLVVFVGVLGMIGIPALLGLMVRDHFLVRAIRRRLDNVRCTGCQYSLLGLHAREGRVQCPECGKEIVLAEIGLKEADLLAPARPGAASGTDA